jgi:hypothetical protein
LTSLTCLLTSCISCLSTAAYADQKPLCSCSLGAPRGGVGTFIFLRRSLVYMQSKSAAQSSSVALGNGQGGQVNTAQGKQEVKGRNVGTGQ